jgi:penicillin-binding protein 1A
MWINYMRSALAGMPETALPRPDGIASAPSDDGGRDDYYYVEFKPPELRPLDTVSDPLSIEDILGAPTSSPGRFVPPAPVPQGRPGGQAPVPPMGGGQPPAPFAGGQPPAPLPDRQPSAPSPGEQAPAPLQDGQLPAQYDEHVLLPE